MLYKKIYIFGSSGSGKTYLANKLSSILKTKYYDLDDVYWIKRYYKKRNKNIRQKMLDNIYKKKGWIIEGVYSSWIEEAIKKSDLVIWLNLPQYIRISRIFKRFFSKKDYNESFKDVLALMNFSRKYKNKDGHYHKHKEIIDKHKINFIYIKNKKELNILIKNIKKSI